MIAELLETGKQNAKKGAYLCDCLGIRERALYKLIADERKAGAAIAASSDPEHAGFYIAADRGEMQRFCDSLARRSRELNRIRKACLASLEKLPEPE